MELLGNFERGLDPSPPTVLEALRYVYLARDFGEPTNECKRTVLLEALGIVEAFSAEQLLLRLGREAEERKLQRQRAEQALTAFDKACVILDDTRAFAKARKVLLDLLAGPEEGGEGGPCEAVDVCIAVLEDHLKHSLGSIPKVTLEQMYNVAIENAHCSSYERKTYSMLRAEGSCSTLIALLTPLYSYSYHLFAQRGFVTPEHEGKVREWMKANPNFNTVQPVKWRY